MSLLVPLFLAGLAAVAVPILVHLVHRERAQAERFPSAMFLRREPYRAMARQRLRHPFLFAMRVLAVALLAFAFSRPFFRGSAGATRLSERGRDVAILLDRSASMGYAERWQRARAAVERTLRTLGAEDRVALIAFDTRAVALTALAGDRNGVRQALAAERPSARSTRYAPALQLAKRLLDEGGRARAEVVLVSDFQRSGWDLRDGPVLNAEQRLTPVDVSEADLSNLAWRGVSVERDSVGSGDAVRVLGRLANTGAARRGVRATLAIGPREIAEQRVDLPADAGAIVTFAGVRAAANANAARLVVHGDSHALDDTLRLVLARPRDVRVLLVEPDAGAAAAQRGFFLREALALGTEPQFAVQVRAHEALTSADVGAADVIVLHDAAWPAGAVARRLTERVSSGAGLVVALGERSRESSWARTPQGVLPLSLPPIVDRSAGRGGTMSWIDQTHAALETFTGGRSGDLS
ncbi:MAG: VWA domain-containing protein, partial [Gemmatimonadaceae bacterium]